MKEYDNFEEFHKAMDDYNYLTPILAYEDDFFINFIMNYHTSQYIKEYDILYLNSREENGKNLYEEFCKKYFFKGISDKYGVKQHLFPLIKMYSKDDGTRGIAFDYYESCLSMVPEEEVIMQINKAKKFEEVFSITKSFLQRKRSEVNDVLKNNTNSSYYTELKSFIENGDIPFSNKTLENMIDYYTDLIMAVNHMRANAKEGLELKVEEFKKCFDIDKLYLIIAKNIMDADLPVAKKYHNMTPAYAQVKVLLETIKENNMRDQYNPKIKYINPSTMKEEKYTFRDLERDDQEMANYADVNDFKAISTDDINRMGLGTLENVRKYHKILNTTPEGEVLTDWEIIKPGEKQEPNNGETKPKKTINASSTSTKEITNNEIVFRRFVFERMPYSYQIIGYEKFAGYIGYVYPNGVVAFEKFYEDEKMTPVKYGNATYIMNISNFAKFTRLDKQQIIEYIKNTDNKDIIRLYHSKNWEQKLFRTINGITYTEEAKMLIDTILANQKNNKKGM